MLAATPPRDSPGSVLPAGLEDLRHSAWPVGWRLIAVTPVGQDAVMLFCIRQRHVPQTLVDVPSKLGDDPSQPAGQPFDGVALVELGAEDQVAPIARRTRSVGAVGAEEVDAEVGVRHIENWVQRRAYRVLLAAAVGRRFDYSRGGQVIPHVH